MTTAVRTLTGWAGQCRSPAGYACGLMAIRIERRRVVGGAVPHETLRNPNGKGA